MPTNQKAILKFWRAIEIFNLPDLLPNSKLYKPNTPLPWELEYEQSENYNWHHVVFLGRVAKEQVVDRIEKTIGYRPSKEDQFEEKVSGYTCLAVMIVNEDGRCNADNGYLQASYLHGLLCLQNKKSLSIIDDELDKTQQAFKDRFGLNPSAQHLEDLESSVINWPLLKKELDILGELGLKKLSWEEAVFIRSFKLSKHTKPDVAFLNSFYLKDLNELIVSSRYGKGLQQLLTTDLLRLERVDMLKDIDAFWRRINVQELPAGRWPSNPKHGLYSAQLAAVTACLYALKNNDGLIGVNGPPGTGKTTLLSDIVAEIIVTRAKKLLKHGAEKLFEKAQKIERTDFTFYYYAPDSMLFSDTGIVVASNNNAAVENISKELPSLNKIDTDYFNEADYFADQTTALLQSENWGLLAVALGNSENKQAFKNNFWYPGIDRMGFKKYLQLQYQKENDRTEESRERFYEVAAELKQLLSEFEVFKKDTGRYFDLLYKLFEDQHLQIDRTDAIEGLKGELEELKRAEKRVINSLQRMNQKVAAAQQDLAQHQQNKPGLFKRSANKLWKETKLQYELILNKNIYALNQEQDQLDAIERKIRATERTIRKKQEVLNAMEQHRSEYEREKLLLHKKYEISLENIPDEKLVAAYFDDKNTFHKTCPWSSIKINKLRSDIFLKSLELHKYAILSNAKPFWNNLNLFVEMLDGKVAISSDIAAGLWQTFFFCVPVVSTSLASVSRLFQSMGKDSIGWLLIDEAGQATPQSAAGIINRCRKCIIIGDPLQIEPVVTVNSKLINMLIGTFNVATEWSPLRSSVQVLADRVSEMGTLLTEEDEEDAIWTGFPLRAHRRCDNPMFNIANKIAYNGQMVKVVEDTVFDWPLGNSQWFDVKGTSVENGHVIAEEIAFLRKKIEDLETAPHEIFIISPFKSVAGKCAETFNGYKHIRCGTIHTFQGKEADIVFLVLGSDPAKPGARAWASKKPNMLNVAVTRAKRKFYVVGNFNLWKSCNYFNILAKEIPVAKST
ncbi:MAG: ATP-binding protein [Niabella sp.]|nr:ATP-binding protein [Niabella sp.]